MISWNNHALLPKVYEGRTPMREYFRLCMIGKEAMAEKREKEVCESEGDQE